MIVRHGYPSNAAALAGLSGAGGRALFEKFDQVEMRGFGAYGAFGEWDPAISALGVKAKVRLAYGAGGAVQSLFPLDWQDALGKAMPVVSLFVPGIFTSPSKGALAKAYRDLGDKIDRWGTVHYEWAKAGKRDDGTPYSWSQWADLGKVYLDSIVYLSALPLTDGFLASGFQSVREFAESVRRLFTPAEWPTWAKVAAGLAGAVAVAYIFNTVRGPR